MASGRDRLKQELLTPPLGDNPEAYQAKVTAVGPPVTVSWQGGSYQFPKLDTYTPAVDDQVAIIRYGGSWLILGTPGGFP